MTVDDYTSEFFAQHLADSRGSARHIVPIVVELLRPRTVVDVGCGIGTWLEVFAEHNITESLGIDGDYIDRSELLIPPARFLAHDLSEPLQLDRQFDLAVSLEVAEHLPVESAEAYVRSLTRLAPAVLFSAAVPGQGGVHHVNERWPSYWASQFAKFGYSCLDAVRPRVWHNQQVVWWYAQNTLLFVSEAIVATRSLRSEREQVGRPMDLVHPRMYEGARQATEGLTTRQLLSMLPHALRRSIGWRVIGHHRGN